MTKSRYNLIMFDDVKLYKKQLLMNSHQHYNHALNVTENILSDKTTFDVYINNEGIHMIKQISTI